MTQVLRIASSVWFVVALAALVVIPRSALIGNAQNSRIDDGYHIHRGLSVLAGRADGLSFNDPPLGEVIIALPLWLGGCRAPEREHKDGGLTVFSWPAERILLVVAIWKSLLFLPLVGVVFAWCRRLYSLTGAWLVTVLLLVEPTVAGHIPVAALDVLAVQAIVLSCALGWSAVNRPTVLRVLAAASATAAAMLIKHTAIVLPFVLGLYALAAWVLRPWWLGRRGRESQRPAGRELAGAACLGAAAMPLLIWAMTLFDVSPIRPPIPAQAAPSAPQGIRSALATPLPAGVYVRSILDARDHVRDGHVGYLWGEQRRHGWWYYHLAAALYKVPLGAWGLMLLTAASLAFVRPRWPELALVVPAAVWAGLLMVSPVNIGFRHALPVYLFLIMLCGRCAVVRLAPWRFAAWAGVAVTGIHAASYHPDYLSYINAHWPRPYLAINDSNIDWGQSLRQVPAWLDENAGLVRGRPVYLSYFGHNGGRPLIRYYLGGRTITVLHRGQSPPEPGGVLIASPYRVAGISDPADALAPLRDREPVDRIGSNLLVYDLDRLHAEHPLQWPAPQTAFSE